MHFSAKSLLVAATLVATTSSHGIITKPWPRTPGNATIAACGTAVVNEIKADNTTHVEGLPEAAATDSGYHAAECNLFLCRGLQYGDNTAYVNKYTPGQVLEIDVYIRIKHEGTANVSVVDAKSNTVISQLKFWDRYADDALAVLPANNTVFNVTIPTDLGTKCVTPGACVSSFLTCGRLIVDVANVNRFCNGGGLGRRHIRLMSLVLISLLLHQQQSIRTDS